MSVENRKLFTEVKNTIKKLKEAKLPIPSGLTDQLGTLEKELRGESPTTGKKKRVGDYKVYTNENRRYAHGGKISGRKAKYNG